MAARPLVGIVGPTATGKTALAIEVAEKFDGEIVCADSRTVYKYLDIGTAKPTPEEQARVPHHLLDVVSPDEPFTVADFKKLANEAIDDIQSRGKVPILVGGSGLYVDAVLFDYQFSPHRATRDVQNPRHLATDVPRVRSELRDNTLLFGLLANREQLRQRIADRVDGMLSHGLIDEVQSLKRDFPNSKALDAPGYKAFSAYLDGRLALDEAKVLFIQSDAQLAKRQHTWFKRNSHIHWFDDGTEALAFATKSLIDSRKTGKNSNIIPSP